MPSGARRLPLRMLSPSFRRALLAVCLLPGTLAAAPAITSAHYDGQTTRYAHGVLGDSVEHTTLVMRLSDGGQRRVTLPERLVFEDTSPRLVDLDADGRPEVLVVESDQSQGARLAVYDADGRITATPFIGTRFRWLAPVGAADLDGDGQIEIAYIDRPHLAKTLRIWRYRARDLVHLADSPGWTNHRIGEPDIAGGIRTCAGSPEMILATANWTGLAALRFRNGEIESIRLGSDTSRPAFARALSCDP